MSESGATAPAVFSTPDGTELELPIAGVTEGASGADIGKLLSKTGYVTFDSGFANTASCASAITYIDGDAGILRYRGYPIDELAENSTFLEVSYLLIYGELPTSDQLATFTDTISRHTLLHEDLKRFFDGFPRDAHPMPVLSSAVSALSTFYQDSLDPFDAEHVDLSTVRLLAKLPTIAAYAYKKSMGQPFLYPENELGYVDNFLRMTFGYPSEPYELDPTVVRALDMLFILHADHEQNCPRRRCASSGPRRRTSSPRFPRASTRCSARCTAVPTSRCSRCSSRSRLTAATSTPSFSASRTRKPV